jgi:hypothetical protein
VRCVDPHAGGEGERSARFCRPASLPRIDVGVDGRGEFFGLHSAGGDRVEVGVVDVWPDRQHLLLLTGLTPAEFAELPQNRRRRGAPWREMMRDAAVFARGMVRHPDHATLVLHTWHRVEMNTEQRARAMRHVAFLD